MQRWSALALLGILATAVVLLVLGVGPKSLPGPAGAATAAPSASASAAPAPSGSAEVDALDPPIDALIPPEVPEEKPAGALLPSGEAAPPLPEGTPKSVGFGVVLVEYRGAQGTTRKARTREAAEVLAKEIAAVAVTDFAAAVAKGDPGSSENAGVLPRGVLEPGPEHVLFTLAVGGVGGPVDTPRGFWIVKRLE